MSNEREDRLIARIDEQKDGAWTKRHMWYVYYTECKKLNDALVKKKAYIARLREHIEQAEHDRDVALEMLKECEHRGWSENTGPLAVRVKLLIKRIARSRGPR